MNARKTTADKIANVQERKQQLENEMKRLMQQQRKEERKARDRRIFRRGAHIESLVAGSPEMSDEQFYRVIINALGKQFPHKKADSLPTGNNAEQTESGVTAF
jgi:translation initiation factor 2 alpha subunit (eIF-2alpha)